LPRRRFLWGLVGFLLSAVIGLAALGALGVLAVMAVSGVVSAPRELRIVAAVSLLLALLLTVRWLARLGRPLGQLVSSARRIEAGDYTARVPEFGPPDVRSVARAFNSMAARLAADEVRRRDFLADVAHEMRTPLSVIQGQAEAIADGVHPADAEHVEPILDASRLLARLVDDLRTLAQVESGALQVIREPVDVARLVEETVMAFGAQAESAGLRLELEVGEGLGSVDGDSARLQGVLGNLISNAIRHTHRAGSVKVSARRSADTLTIAVIDDGEGIQPDLLPRVFDRFVRGPRSDGTGLGLAIARDVVNAHGGTIQIDSRPGSGTSVLVSLPARQGQTRT
jgi:two-component system, OmpR family, sensor histidine kinase BaeS